MSDAPTSPAAPPATWHRHTTHAGLALWALGLVGLAILYLADPTQSIAALLSVATFYYAGQFGAIPLGIAAGGHPALVGLYVWIADAAGLLVFFPLTQLGVDRLARRTGLVAQWIQRTQARAERRRAFIERYGPWGIFLFTSLPFLFNSPILGAALGRIAGVPARRTLGALLAAVTIMSVVWTLLFHYGLALARERDANLPWFFALGTVAMTFLVAGALALTRRLRTRRAPTDELRTPPS